MFVYGVSSIRSKQTIFLTFFEAGFWAWKAGPGRWGFLAGRGSGSAWQGWPPGVTEAGTVSEGHEKGTHGTLSSNTSWDARPQAVAYGTSPRMVTFLAVRLARKGVSEVGGPSPPKL